MNAEKLLNDSARNKKYIKLTLSEQEYERVDTIAKYLGINPTKLVTHVVMSTLILHTSISDPLESLKIEKGEKDEE